MCFSLQIKSHWESEINYLHLLNRIKNFRLLNLVITVVKIILYLNTLSCLFWKYDLRFKEHSAFIHQWNFFSKSVAWRSHYMVIFATARYLPQFLCSEWKSW